MGEERLTMMDFWKGGYGLKYRIILTVPFLLLKYVIVPLLDFRIFVFNHKRWFYEKLLQDDFNNKLVEFDCHNGYGCLKLGEGSKAKMFLESEFQKSEVR